MHTLHHLRHRHRLLPPLPSTSISPFKFGCRLPMMIDPTPSRQAFPTEMLFFCLLISPKIALQEVELFEPVDSKYNRKVVKFIPKHLKKFKINRHSVSSLDAVS